MRLLDVIKMLIQKSILNSKWLLLPFIFRLIYSFIIFGKKFVIEGHVENEDVIHILHDIDIVMIGYLARMIIIGLYNSAIDKTHGDIHENISSGLLKVKLSTSILGVSTVHLLKIFMNAETAKIETVGVQLAIHLVLIIGSFYLMKMEKMHAEMENKH